MYDLVIKNGFVIDGTGAPAFPSDLGLLNGKIKSIGLIKENLGKKVIDVYGMCVSPGFIDIHGHSDLFLSHDQTMLNKLKQGITTEVAGNCGSSVIPVSELHFNELRKQTGYIDGDGINRIENWKNMKTFGNYVDYIDNQKLGANISLLVGHGTIRIMIMGMANREATDSELCQMKNIIREAMENGALGLSSGLFYPPGNYATKEEIIEMCKVVSKYGGFYATHIRNESHRIIESVEEAIDIGRKSGVRVLISHHKIAGKENWGKSVSTINLIEKARHEGIDVYIDQYPYRAGSTLLGAVIPPKFTSYGMSNLIDTLQDPVMSNQIKQEMLKKDPNRQNLLLEAGYEGVIVTVDGVQMSIADYANKQHMDPIDATFKLIIETKGSCPAIFFLMDEEDIKKIMTYPQTMIATDAGVDIPQMGNHPRIYGTFPRVLGKYVREEKVLELEEAIRKMTSLPSTFAGLVGKGFIKKGYDADLVIFNRKTINDNAGYTQMSKNNEGISYVIVGGNIVLDHNQLINRKSGHFIKRNNVKNGGVINEK